MSNISSEEIHSADTMTDVIKRRKTVMTEEETRVKEQETKQE